VTKETLFAGMQSMEFGECHKSSSMNWSNLKTILPNIKKSVGDQLGEESNRGQKQVPVEEESD
jgi:hypothetical protein